MPTIIDIMVGMIEFVTAIFEVLFESTLKTFKGEKLDKIERIQIAIFSFLFLFILGAAFYNNLF